MSKTKIAAAQLTPAFLNKEKTVEIACNAILEAGKKGAKVIDFPEAFRPDIPIIPSKLLKSI